MIILYSTNCPKCNVLAQKLKKMGIDFQISYDTDQLIKLGFMEAPILKVENQYFNFSKAIKWIKEQEK